MLNNFLTYSVTALRLGVCGFFNVKETYMSSDQLQRLEKDSADLADYITTLTKRGMNDLANKIKVKKEFLDNKIAEVQT